jgi:hypothetical protein
MEPNQVLLPHGAKVPANKCILLVIITTVSIGLYAQRTEDLTDFAAFQAPASNWQLVGDVRANLDKDNIFFLSPGKSILVSQAKENTHAQDLVFKSMHGDADVELDYMMAKNSNSGIYLQGRYEIQLRDSWSLVITRAADNGGIYERWNEEKPEGQKGYEGKAPRQNASRAPGLWQHIKISFQAPRFNTIGEKVENARIIRVTLNGVIIHDNVELSGPTRGALQNNEVALGPLRFQGDHGSVAFRNIVVTEFNQKKPMLHDIKYAVYKGKFSGEDYKKARLFAQGTTGILSSNISNLENEFVTRYTGTLRISEPGAYQFHLNALGGTGSLSINNKMVLNKPQSDDNGEMILAAGDAPFELVYAKIFDYAKPGLTLSVAGPGIREFIISDGNVPSGNPIDPILLPASVNTVLRSFIDLDTVRITHAASVGSPQQIHYSYDMDKGMIVQVWRGDFLDATPMWHSRGDGSSRAAGSLIRFGNPMMSLQVLNSPEATWSSDTAGTGYRSKGYTLDGADRPTFRYQVYKTMVNDVSRIMEDNHGIHREIAVVQPVEHLYLRLAEGQDIENPSAGLYLINDKSYYLLLDDATIKPLIRDRNGLKELIVPIHTKISYSILF